MKWIAPVSFVALLVAGAGIVYVAMVGLMGNTSLGKDAVVAEARVTGARTVTHPKRGETFEVQYAIQVGEKTYTSRDGTGRTNLWVPLTRDAWDAARTKGTTPVSYLPRDPWTSRAVHAAGDPVESNVIGLIIGLILMLPATLWIASLVRRKRVLPA